MTDLKCPGRLANSNLDTTLIPCPECGHVVELFGDEIKVHCHCGHWVFRDALPSCAQWCQEAERCFGQAGSFPKTMRSCSAEDLKEQEARLRELQGRVTVALARCARPEAKQKDAV